MREKKLDAEKEPNSVGNWGQQSKTIQRVKVVKRGSGPIGYCSNTGPFSLRSPRVGIKATLTSSGNFTF